LDTLLGTGLGSILAGNPLNSYVTGGEMLEKGVSLFAVTAFITVKPFLLPVMISYFGWVYVLLLTFFTIIGSVAAGYLVGFLVKEHFPDFD